MAKKSQYLSNRQFIFTFGFARSSEGVERAFVDMEYVASDELGNLVRLGIFREMHFTYAVQLVRKNYYHTPKHVQLTPDDVHKSWARVVCGDRNAGGKLTDPSQ